MAAKRKQRSYSVDFKLKIFEEVEEKVLSKTEICKKYNISNSTLSTFLKNRKKIEQMDQRIQCKDEKIKQECTLVHRQLPSTPQSRQTAQCEGRVLTTSDDVPFAALRPRDNTMLQEALQTHSSATVHPCYRKQQSVQANCFGCYGVHRDCLEEGVCGCYCQLFSSCRVH